MQESDRNILCENNQYLRDNLHFNDKFIEVLVNYEVLLPDHVDIIENQNNSSKVIEKFLNILPKRGQKAFEYFMEALFKSEQQDILEKLKKDYKQPVSAIQESFDYTDNGSTRRSMLLINIMNKDCKDLIRTGSEKDLKDIAEVFVNKLNYELFRNKPHENLCRKDILSIVKEFVQYISANYITKSVFIIMCHGNEDNCIKCEKDEDIKINEIIDCFGVDKIAGVFKVMIFACCRGNTALREVPESKGNVNHSSDHNWQFAANDVENQAMQRTNCTQSTKLGYKDPSNSIILYSTQKNYVSHRAVGEGTPFIQSLVSVLKKSDQNKPIRELVLEIKPEMKITNKNYIQIPDIKEYYFGNFHF